MTKGPRGGDGPAARLPSSPLHGQSRHFAHQQLLQQPPERRHERRQRERRVRRRGQHGEHRRGVSGVWGGDGKCLHVDARRKRGRRLAINDNEPRPRLLQRLPRAELKGVNPASTV